MEEKYIPAVDGLSTEKQAGIVASQKKPPEKRSNRFKAGMG